MSRELSYLEAIREALIEEMRRDAKVFVLGEDVGAYGGAFGVTQGLYDEFGESRVLDTPISESAIVGISIGASLRGYRPVAEMQFADFISCAFDQIVNQAATLRYRYGGRASVPIVIRAPSGGNVGGGLYHSQNPEAWFVHRAGLKVVAPATAYDAKGLLKAAIRDDNPVVFCEHKYLVSSGERPRARGRRDRTHRYRGDEARRQRRHARDLWSDADTVARSGGPACKGGRGGRGHRPPDLASFRQNGDLPIRRQDQPRIDRS